LTHRRTFDNKNTHPPQQNKSTQKRKHKTQPERKNPPKQNKTLKNTKLGKTESTEKCAKQVQPKSGTKILTELNPVTGIKGSGTAIAGV
jgi:hypothetical protein